MEKKPKIPVVAHDPTLIDFLLENRVAHTILKILSRQGSERPEGWVKVPDIVKEVGKFAQSSKFKNLRSTVHYYCRRLCDKYKAIDRYKNDRPVYYRITDKGKTHLNKIQDKGKEKG